MSVSSLFKSCRRFSVSGEPPDDYTAKFIEALNSEAFREDISKISKERRSGWVVYDHPLTTDFSDINGWLFNQYILLSLRVDQRKVPTRLLKARLQAAVEKWCAENNRERAPSAVKSELKEAIEMDLLKHTLPTMRVFHAVWNVSMGWVVFSGKADTMSDLFRKLFHRTFGLVLTASPLDGLDEDGEPVAVPGRLRFEDAASDWLTWAIWKGSEKGKVEVEGESVEFWIEEGVKLDGIRTDEVGPVLMTALAQEKPPEALTLSVRKSDREYRVRLDGLDQGGVKLPALVKGGDLAEQVYEAGFLYEESQFLLGGLFDAFKAERERAEAQHRAVIDRWLGVGLDPVREFLERLRSS